MAYAYTTHARLLTKLKVGGEAEGEEARRHEGVIAVEEGRVERTAPSFSTSESLTTKLPWRCRLHFRSSQADPCVVARRAAP